MGCRLLEWKTRAITNGWSREEFLIITGGVVACAYHRVIHTENEGDIPFTREVSEDEI